MGIRSSKSQGKGGSTDEETGIQAPSDPPGDREPEEITLPAGGDPLAGAGSNMPDVQQHAVDAEKKRADDAAAIEAANAPPAGSIVDKAGTIFDPSIHENDGGVPRLTLAGNFKKKRGGNHSARGEARKVNTGKPTEGSAPKDPNAKPPATEAEIQGAAAGSAELIFALGYIVGGDEWLPQKLKLADDQEVDERAQLTGALSVYYRAKGITDIPPGILVAAVVIGYAAKRFQMPKTKTRWQAVKTWAYGWIGWFRGRRAAVASKDAKAEKSAERVSSVPSDAKEAESVSVNGQ